MLFLRSFKPKPTFDQKNTNTWFSDHRAVLRSTPYPHHRGWCRPWAWTRVTATPTWRTMTSQNSLKQLSEKCHEVHPTFRAAPRQTGTRETPPAGTALHPTSRSSPSTATAWDSLDLLEGTSSTENRWWLSDQLLSSGKHPQMIWAQNGRAALRVSVPRWVTHLPDFREPELEVTGL